MLAWQNLKKGTHWPRTGPQIEIGPVIEILIKCFKRSVKMFATRERSEATQISLSRNGPKISARLQLGRIWYQLGEN